MDVSNSPSQISSVPVFDKKWLRNRELGFKPKIGTQDKFMNCLYSSVIPCNTWDHNKSVKSGVPGGIFNLEFSPDGSMLVAACEKKSILMFDPLSRNLIRAIDNAHNDCVNCVRFLDSRVFATCSDDNTVALWDARNLKARIRTLHGHSNWVKNIEFSQSDGLLVTSGFDGSIFTWDINSYSESLYSYNRVFHTNGLMRTRLNHDASKMIICTTGGYLIIIHNLNLKTLEQDLGGFKPNMYRLMQLSQTTIPIVACYTHLFSKHRKTNRLEFVTDFPEGDEAEVVSSLQVHPQGWCALSRNISSDESTEWTCIHDIQEKEYGETETESEMSEDEDTSATSATDANSSTTNPDSRTDENAGNASEEGSAQRPSAHDLEREREFSHRRVRSVSGSAYYFRGFPASGDLDGNPMTTHAHDIWEALVALREVRAQRDRERVEAERRNNGVEIALSSAPETRMRVVRMSSGLPDAIHAIEERRERVMRRRLANERERERERARERESSAERERDRADSSDTDSPPHPPQSPRVTTITYNFMRYGRRRRGRQERSGTWEERAGGNQGAGGAGGANGGGRVRVGELEASNITRVRSHAVVILGSARNRMHQMMVQPWCSSHRSNKALNNHKIHNNVPRLTHYIQEPNLGKGFIKELCFSSDGRLICSPFGYGVRLLAFSPQCSELSTCVPKSEAVNLHVIGTNVCHSDIVVSTKFSPRHCLLVSGCLTGRIVWHQPVIQN